MGIDVYDFFSGCGGASSGFRDAGFNVKMGLDSDSDAIKTFSLNFPEAEAISRDIRLVQPRDLQALISRGRSSRKILFSGCAPCQPFSKQNRKGVGGDERADLLDEFGRFVEFWVPEYIFVENVPGIQAAAVKSSVFNRFLSLLERLGYNYDYSVIEAKSYGVPQKRARLVLLASLDGLIKIPPPTHGAGLLPYTTVGDWILDFPPILSGEVHQGDQDHFALSLSSLNLRRIRATPQGGGRESWPEELILDCHKSHKGHTDVYGRLRWDRPASGLTTKCISYSNGRFGHPEQDRAISLREAACLQTFPKSFRFFGSKASKARQVGNAVPPLLAKALATAFINAA